MLYILAFFVPPLAVLFAGKPFQALLNLGLTALLWFPGAIHAILVVKDHKADKRMEKQVKLMKQQ
ncbi:MAG: YqaE/Pmp3 family membrane protein [Bacillota bacterium]